MATLRNMRKLAALNKQNFEEHPRSNLPQNTNVPRSRNDYITQASEEIEDRVTKKVSQEFSRTGICILGVLSRFDEFLLNPPIQGHTKATPETTENAFRTKQGTNEENSQKARVFPSQTMKKSGPDDRYDTLLLLNTRKICLRR